MKREDYKNLGISGFMEWDILFNFLSKFPPKVYKSFVILIGVAFIVLGIVIIL